MLTSNLHNALHVLIRTALPCVLIVLCLSSCAKPGYYAPQVSKQEIAAEQAQQLSMVSEEESKRLLKSLTRDVSAKERADMEYTLQLVGGRIQNAGTAICRQLTSPGNPCRYKFELDKKNPGPNAYADGKRIVISLYPQ